ncbi:MAG: sodium:proton antiporter [Kistimonas sp.]|nr:sodium:proton antiporter [Kistimonas sp.]
MNAVVLAVLVMLALNMLRVNVVLALVVGALAGGSVTHLGFSASLASFSQGVGAGANIALGYALLGAFAMGLSSSGVPAWLVGKIKKQLLRSPHKSGQNRFLLLLVIVLIAVASENLVPIHIAFIPLLIPPLLGVFADLRIDRRLVACCLTFGLTASYMLLPAGFGHVFLIEVLARNLQENGLTIDPASMPLAMAIPVGGMLLGLLVASRSYRTTQAPEMTAVPAPTPEEPALPLSKALGAALATVLTVVCQIKTGSIVIGALAGCLTLPLTGVLRLRDSNEVFIRGMKTMAWFCFVMIAAAGFAQVIRDTGAVADLVASSQGMLAHHPFVTILLMLLTGLLITMGVGSSFATVPVLATLYVPIGMEMGLSSLAIAALVGTAGALGDAGSPASDSTLGPTAGLNADGRHDHIRGSVLPTFLHFNVPLILFGWLAVILL